MPRLFPLAASCVVVVAVAPVHVAAAQEVDNPQYTSWSKFPKGTILKTRSTTRVASRDDQVTTSTTYTLTNVTPERVVLEMVVESDATGTKVKNTAQELVIRRAFYLLPGIKKEDLGKPQGAIAQGEETVQVAGKEYRATWFDTKGSTEVGESLTRTWMSDEVPGRMLKSVVRVPKITKTTTLEVTELKTP